MIKGYETTQARDTVLHTWGNKPALVFGKWNQPRPVNTRHRLIWSKHPNPGMGDLTMPWGNSDEEIYVLGKGWVGKRRSNIISHPTLNSASKDRPNHPTPKPVGLMEQLIAYAPEGIIIDPFMGSGATIRAAKNLGRKAIGVEIEEEYCELTVSLLSQQTLLI